jgi:hypothetical protein
MSESGKHCNFLLFFSSIDADCNAVCVMKNDQLQAQFAMPFMLTAGMDYRTDLIAFLSSKSTSAMRYQFS